VRRHHYPSLLAAAALLACAAPAPAARVPAAAPTEAAWWRAYGDPQLDALMAEALAGAPGLEIAAQRLRVAAQAAPAGRPGPRLGAPDLELWARNRAALVTAASETESAQLEAAEARLLLATSLVDAYGEFWRQAASRDAAEALARNRALAADLVGSRLRDGAPMTFDLRKTLAAAAAARVALAVAETQVAAARNRLAALAGADPARGQALRPPAIAGRLRLEPGADLTAELANRRPDLLAARWRTAAAEARLRVAQATGPPHAGLSSLFAVQALGITHLVRSGSDVGQAGLGFWSPVIEGDDGPAQAERDALAAAYDQALAAALAEVAQASAAERALDTQLEQARTGLARAEAEARIARQRYEQGAVSRGALIAAEDAIIAHRSRLDGLEAQRLSADAALARAMGGAGAQSSLTETPGSVRQ
jgi:outer membrane protein TolC